MCGHERNDERPFCPRQPNPRVVFKFERRAPYCASSPLLIVMPRLRVIDVASSRRASLLGMRLGVHLTTMAETRKHDTATT